MPGRTKPLKSVGVSGFSRYWQWLQAAPPYSNPLAWCHSTDAYALRDLIEGGHFAPVACPVFKEDLLYFFYGRPAYRVGDDAAMQISARAPVVVLLSPELIVHGVRMFPFDTGAFEAGRYRRWLHERMRLADFEMHCCADAPQRHVYSYFDSNSRYLRLQAKSVMPDFNGTFEAESLGQLFTDRDATNADDRRVAVELQVQTAIPFKFPEIRALIVADEQVETDYFRDFMQGSGKGIEVIKYEVQLMKRTCEYQSMLEKEAVVAQEKWGMG
jgi:hypothetical protein